MSLSMVIHNFLTTVFMYLGYFFVDGKGSMSMYLGYIDLLVNLLVIRAFDAPSLSMFVWSYTFTDLSGFTILTCHGSGLTILTYQWVRFLTCQGSDSLLTSWGRGGVRWSAGHAWAPVHVVISGSMAVKIDPCVVLIVGHLYVYKLKIRLAKNKIQVSIFWKTDAECPTNPPLACEVF